MDQTTKDKLAINVANSWKMASNYVMVGAGIAFAYWLTLSPEQQALIISHLPIPPWLIPIATGFAGFAARLWPQKSITPAVAAAKSEDAPQPAEPLSLRDPVDPTK